jgi:hypothetical protein
MATSPQASVRNFKILASAPMVARIRKCAKVHMRKRKMHKTLRGSFLMLFLLFAALWAAKRFGLGIEFKVAAFVVYLAYMLRFFYKRSMAETGIGHRAK